MGPEKEKKDQLAYFEYLDFFDVSKKIVCYIEVNASVFDEF
jgi:hypothetical protein